MRDRAGEEEGRSVILRAAQGPQRGHVRLFLLPWMDSAPEGKSPTQGRTGGHSGYPFSVAGGLLFDDLSAEFELDFLQETRTLKIT